MPQAIKIISSRRAYEFRQDELRLTVLSAGPLIERIQQAFGFQGAQIGTPAPTFGEVPLTLPAGIVFSSGSVIDEQHGIIPIRFLNFEQRRIVIDVAAPSVCLDVVYDALATMVSSLLAPDGNPALGIPYRRRDVSDISLQLDFPIIALLAPNLAPVFEEGIGLSDASQALLPTLTFQRQEGPGEYAGTAAVNQNNGPMLQFALRQGTALDEHVFFSTAPLPSDAHLAYLTRLEQTITTPLLRDRNQAKKARKTTAVDHP